uniref:Uncharacterized protein n=1 Tax=Arundo donax TaxID=35708 RepID=A0A0A9BGJ1_ARUDO
MVYYGDEKKAIRYNISYVSCEQGIISLESYSNLLAVHACQLSVDNLEWRPQINGMPKPLKHMAVF